MNYLTIPNALTILRGLGIPLFIYLALSLEADGWAILTLAVAGATDYFDGKLARAWNQTSKFGEFLDPAIDRLYINATLIVLYLRDAIPLWLIVILFSRDLILLFLLLHCSSSINHRSRFHIWVRLQPLTSYTPFPCSCWPLLTLGMEPSPSSQDGALQFGGLDSI